MPKLKINWTTSCGSETCLIKSLFFRCFFCRTNIKYLSFFQTCDLRTFIAAKPSRLAWVGEKGFVIWILRIFLLNECWKLKFLNHPSEDWSFTCNQPSLKPLWRATFPRHCSQFDENLFWKHFTEIGVSDVLGVFFIVFLLSYWVFKAT